MRWSPAREGGTATGEKTITKVRCRHRDGGGDGARQVNMVRTGKNLAIPMLSGEGCIVRVHRRRCNSFRRSTRFFDECCRDVGMLNGVMEGRELR